MFTSFAQAKKEKRDLEMGERMSNNYTTVNIIPEVYDKIRVPGDNILKSKLVQIKLYKVGSEHFEKHRNLCFRLEMVIPSHSSRPT